MKYVNMDNLSQLHMSVLKYKMFNGDRCSKNLLYSIKLMSNSVFYAK